MKGTERHDRILVDEMLQHLAVVVTSASSGKVTLAKDAQPRYALEHAIELLAEAGEKVSRDFKSANPGIPWAQLRPLRRTLAHPYDTDAAQVSVDQLWVFSAKVVPRLYRRLKSPKFPRYATEDERAARRR